MTKAELMAFVIRPWSFGIQPKTYLKGIGTSTIPSDLFGLQDLLDRVGMPPVQSAI
jgi:hypothetical protein